MAGRGCSSTAREHSLIESTTMSSSSLIPDHQPTRMWSRMGGKCSTMAKGRGATLGPSAFFSSPQRCCKDSEDVVTISSQSKHLIGTSGESGSHSHRSALPSGNDSLAGTASRDRPSQPGMGAGGALGSTRARVGAISTGGSSLTGMQLEDRTLGCRGQIEQARG